LLLIVIFEKIQGRREKVQKKIILLQRRRDAKKVKAGKITAIGEPANQD